MKCWFGRNHRKVSVVAGSVVVVLLAVAVVGPYLGRTHAAPGATSLSGSATMKTVYRSTSLSSVTNGAGGLWVTDDVTNRLIHVNPTSGTSIGPSVAVPGRPTAVAEGYGKLWVASMLSDTVEAVNPKTYRVTSTTSVPTGPVSLSAGSGCMWVASVIAGSVTCLDPASGAVTTTIVLPDGAVRLSADGTGVWVTGVTNTLSHLTPSAGPATPGPTNPGTSGTSGTSGPQGSQGSQASFTVHTVQVGNGPIGVAITSRGIWVANASDGTVTEVDGDTMRSIRTVRVGVDPVGIAGAVDGIHVWVADGSSRHLYAIDETAGAHVAEVGTFPGIPRYLLDQGGTVWAALGAPGSLVAIDHPRR